MPKPFRSYGSPAPALATGGISQNHRTRSVSVPHTQPVIDTARYLARLKSRGRLLGGKLRPGPVAVDNRFREISAQQPDTPGSPADSQERPADAPADGSSSS